MTLKKIINNGIITGMAILSLNGCIGMHNNIAFTVKDDYSTYPKHTKEIAEYNIKGMLKTECDKSELNMFGLNCTNTRCDGSGYFNNKENYFVKPNCTENVYSLSWNDLNGKNPIKTDYTKFANGQYEYCVKIELKKPLSPKFYCFEKDRTKAEAFKKALEYYLGYRK